MLLKSLFICYSTPNYSKLTKICLDSLHHINVDNINHKIDYPPDILLKQTGVITPLWYYCIRNKINHLINVINNYEKIKDTQYFIFTDIDIVYIPNNVIEWYNLEKYIQDTSKDIFFMRERNNQEFINSSFFIIKNNNNIKNIIDFFVKVLKTIDITDKTDMPNGDQTIINNLKTEINYGFIPCDYLVFGNNILNHTKSLLHLAVCCPDVDSKIEQINQIKSIFTRENKSLIVKIRNYMFDIQQIKHDNEICCVTVSNIMDSNKMKYILESCSLQYNNLNIIGVGQKWSFIKKIYWTYDFLIKCKYKIIIFTDAYDVFYLNNINIIKNKFIKMNTDILWSSEKWYSHQLQIDREFYDNIGKGDYKYLNTGTMIGYTAQLIDFYTDLINNIETNDFWLRLNKENWYRDTSAVDQTLISHYIANNYYKYNLSLDYNLNIFYVPVQDWDNINLCKQNLEKYKPTIIHCPWFGKYSDILVGLFYYKYNYLINKHYKWENETITFLENGKINGFGNGDYQYIDKYLVQCVFGNMEYLFKFNNEYSDFYSIRKDDLNGILDKNIILFKHQ